MISLRRVSLAVVAVVVVAATVFAAIWVSLTQPWVASPPAATVSEPASATRLRSDVETLAIRFAGRSYDNLTALDGAAAFIESRFASQGHVVHSQRFAAKRRAYRNLVVRLGPDTPEVMVIGAHYDVFRDLPGADDNASGVAGLIELGQLLRGQPLKQRVELVAYTNEEPPFFRTQHMGSAVHARNLKESGQRASLMLSLECIGYFSDAPDSQSHPVRLLNAIYPTTGNFIALVGFVQDGLVMRRVKSAMQSGSDLPVHSINAPGFVVGVDFSDHLNYANEGFSGMMVTDTAFFRNRAYHTTRDTPDRLDYRRMAQVVDGVRAVVLHEAGMAAEPASRE